MRLQVVISAVIAATTALAPWVATAQGVTQLTMPTATASDAPAPLADGEQSAPINTRAGFFLAAGRGQLVSVMNQLRGDPAQRERVARLVLDILVREEGLPPVPAEPYCQTVMLNVIGSSLVTASDLFTSTLSRDGPEFRRRSSEHIDSLKFRIDRMGYSHCLDKANRPYPIEPAFAAFLNEFMRATAAAVESEREVRKRAYAVEQERLAAERANAQQAARKAEEDKRRAALVEEQKRLDAERARIEAEQKRRRQKEQARISG